MRNRSDPSYFGGRGEIHSVVYGLRNWFVDPYGRLAGIVYKTAVWRPGENHARCMRTPATAVSLPYIPSSLTSSVKPQPKDGWPADHSMIACDKNGNGHGFYAYYDGSRDYHERGDVTGVIKGWGEGVVGEKGFRVMIAEIVAFKFSGSIPAPMRDRVRSLYPDVAVFDSVDRMLAEYPLTADGLEYVPDADDDFWTREA